MAVCKTLLEDTKIIPPSYTIYSTWEIASIGHPSTTKKGDSGLLPKSTINVAQTFFMIIQPSSHIIVISLTNVQNKGKIATPFINIRPVYVVSL